MKKLLLFLCVASFFSTFSQTEDAWLYLKDKPNSATFLQNPLQMLSQRSLDRRIIQNISLDVKDVPIDENYYNQLKNEGNITVLGKSKWLNAIHVQGTVSQINGLLSNFTFIESIEFANKSLNPGAKKRVKSVTPNHQNKFSNTTTDFIYGNAENQIKMLKGDFLHEQNFTGEGMQIAIIDAGFPNVNTLSAFQRIRDNNQILGGYNFADRNTDIYTRDSHGTHVLSTIAGYVENQFVGTAPDAKFYLFISEIAETETVLEETLWVEAAERADSLGVNVINTSLGYTTYDNPDHSHSYADMDGKTTFISRGAEIGASRGIILVNAAGNEGGDSWKYIGAPADAVSVFSIGAVNSSENIVYFSSFGPTADNRIKPDVLAKGQSAAVINYSSGNISTSNGTSFSSPIMTGVVACFWQAFPNKTNFEIMDLIRKSADKYNNPTDQYGYGVPDFETAYNQVLSTNDFSNSTISIYPNPVKNSFSFSFEGTSVENLSIQIFNILGEKVLEKSKLISNTVDISNLEAGFYMLKIQMENQQKTVKLIKQ
ncbi:Por secretion system C-terminal sorting domain-containing protein [Polaribacter sp. KT25b]|uniref:S8 family serine peptidase n=1 Tax=Polaribacter sp. KT25b TaxID=1855336 RepID=UPI00087C5B29|nr:S8 family serine peptidase [Polaribacter sp. KT25b]SDR88341.1 Por secretion system C-terminal sorting domain-containing protein [Polaribacter sp. KT25b]